MLQQTIETVKKAMLIPMIKTDKSLPTDGYRETKDFIFSIQRDYFVSSPALHDAVRIQVERIEKMISRAQLLIVTAEEKMDFVKFYENWVRDYYEALITGVIAVEGRVVAYNRNNNGVKDTVILSKRGEEYPFNNIPLYQGFLNYQLLEYDVKSEIKETVDERLKIDAPEIHTIGRELKAFLSSDRLDAYCQLAANYKESTEIITFISKLKREMDTLFL